MYNYQFVEDIRKKIDTLLENLDITVDKNFVAEEVLKLIGGCAINEMLSTLPEDQRNELIKGFNERQHEQQTLKLKQLFTEEKIKEVYLKCYKQQINNLIERFGSKIKDIDKFNALIS